MQYEEALNYIHNTLKFGIKLGLENIRTLLDFMGNPHEKLKFVHVAGTNGKGSTVAFLSSILVESGYKVGIYTSPYLERFTERIKINNDEIQIAELARITEFVKEKVELMVNRGFNHPTEFEIVTAIAFQYYHENNCDIVVLEVGLGGRYDSTNVIESSLVSVITTISFDHMDRLGNTLPEIAFEKAGIIKKGGEVVLYPQENEVEKVIIDVCREKGANLKKAEINKCNIISFDLNGQIFDYNEYKSLKISLLGEHQVNNAIVAINVSEILSCLGYSISEESIRLGLKNAKWPGRFEVLNKVPLFLVDGAHNAQGAIVLKDALNMYFPNKKKIFIMGVLKDKDYKSMVQTIGPTADRIITITPDNERALDARELSKVCGKYCKNVIFNDTIENAIKTALGEATSDDLICAFGSLYYIGEVKKIFNLSLNKQNK